MYLCVLANDGMTRREKMKHLDLTESGCFDLHDIEALRGNWCMYLHAYISPAMCML